MKKILGFAAIVLLLAGGFSCGKEKENTPRYILCDKTGGNYIDTINLRGNGYLFLNSIPASLENQKNLAFVVYFPEQDSAVFKIAYSDAIYSADICNFPNYAKHWEIPLQGKAFLFKGEFYEEGRYLSVPAYVGGKIVFTMFKPNKQ
jgi:hypothetical protein